MSLIKSTWSLSLLSLILLAGCQCGLDGESCKKNKENLSPPTETVLMGDVAENLILDAKPSVFSEGENVYYGYDKYDVDSHAQKVLEAQATWLAAHPEKTILIEGRCDERGTREYNLALGERRANAAKNYLIALGVNAQRISTISYGKDKPVVLGSTPEAWALNRASTTRIEN